MTIDVSPTVAEALAAGQPTVALEFDDPLSRHPDAA